MRRSLLVFNILLLRPFDTSVRKFLSGNSVLTMIKFSATSPVPVKSSDKLKSCDLLIGEIGNDLEHLATVAVETENFQVQETWSVDSVLEEQGAGCHGTNHPSCILGILPEKSFHFNLLINYKIKLAGINN